MSGHPGYFGTKCNFCGATINARGDVVQVYCEKCGFVSLHFVVAHVHEEPEVGPSLDYLALEYQKEVYKDVTF